MTNEQLALYLRSLAGNLIGLAGDISELITEGERETIPVWVGEGEPEFRLDSLDLRIPQRFFELPEGWERRAEGDFKAVILIRGFVQHLHEEAERLTRGKP